MRYGTGIPLPNRQVQEGAARTTLDDRTRWRREARGALCYQLQELVDEEPLQHVDAPGTIMIRASTPGSTSWLPALLWSTDDVLASFIMETPPTHRILVRNLRRCSAIVRQIRHGPSATEAKSAGWAWRSLVTSVPSRPSSAVRKNSKYSW